jgi:hypothetical protein
MTRKIMKGGTLTQLKYDKLDTWKKLDTCVGTNCGYNVAHFLDYLSREDAEKLAESGMMKQEQLRRHIKKKTGRDISFVNIYNRGYDIDWNKLFKLFFANDLGMLLITYKKGCSAIAHLTLLYRRFSMHSGKREDFVILDPQTNRLINFISSLKKNVENAELVLFNDVASLDFSKKKDIIKYHKMRSKDLRIRTREHSNIYKRINELMHSHVVEPHVLCPDLTIPYGSPLYINCDNVVRFGPVNDIKKRIIKWNQQMKPLSGDMEKGSGINILYFMSLINYNQAQNLYKKHVIRESGDFLLEDLANLLKRSRHVKVKIKVTDKVLSHDVFRGDWLPEGTITLVQFPDINNVVMIMKKVKIYVINLMGKIAWSYVYGESNVLKEIIDKGGMMKILQCEPKEKHTKTTIKKSSHGKPTAKKCRTVKKTRNKVRIRKPSSVKSSTKRNRTARKSSEVKPAGGMDIEDEPAGGMDLEEESVKRSQTRKNKKLSRQTFRKRTSRNTSRK